MGKYAFNIHHKLKKKITKHNKEIKMGAQNFILLVVGIYFCINSVAFADEGTATYYTAPYVREYI